MVHVGKWASNRPQLMPRYVPFNGKSLKSKKTESISVGESHLNAHREPDFKCP